VGGTKKKKTNEGNDKKREIIEKLGVKTVSIEQKTFLQS